MNDKPYQQMNMPANLIHHLIRDHVLDWRPVSPTLAGFGL